MVPPEGEILTCSVVTCESNDLLHALPHHRMPALLEGEALHRWLDPACERPEDLLRPTDADRMVARVEPVRRPRAAKRIDPPDDAQTILDFGFTT